jgi:ADP-ribose pyrophosphatase
MGEGGSTIPLVRSSRTVYEGKIVRLRVDEVELSGGRTATREVVDSPGAVVIAAVDAEDRVCLVEQHRYAVGRDLLELPAGMIEPGEAPLETARRELREETGLAAERWDSLGSFFSSPGFVGEQLHAFLACGLRAGDADPDEDEDLQVVWRPLERLLTDPAEIVDGKTLATLLLIQAHVGPVSLGIEKGVDG